MHSAQGTKVGNDLFTYKPKVGKVFWEARFSLGMFSIAMISSNEKISHISLTCISFILIRKS